ncbi:mitochondrial carrier [Violaceomyces palustris]|uniref:Mitochondrial carrier n=1 Tax=Violaceomyces palustris TaxID=1673888 RepID=A0ACD0P5T8_9BASI|nr:mitochondrial carrier [Violaceomyces palustris]
MDTVVAGALAAFVVDLSIYPLDTLKTRLQTPDLKSRFPNGRGLYSGLYQGVGSVIVATLPAAGVFFTTYEQTKRTLNSDTSPLNGSNTAFSHMISSCAAELVSCLVLTPAEILKQRAQVINKKQEAAAVDALGSKRAEAPRAGSEKGVATREARGSEVRGDDRRLDRAKVQVQSITREPCGNTRKDRLGGSASSSSIKGQGRLFSNFGRSYLALAGRNLPFTAIQFPLYEDLRSKISDWVGLRVDGTGSRGGGGGGGGGGSDLVKVGLVSGSSAAIAGSVSALLTTPIDVAKTRIMISSGGGGSGSGGGVMEVMLAIASKEGPRALMRGGLLRSTWTALGAGVYLGSYESGRLWYTSRNPE